MHQLRQFGERSADLRVDLARLGVDQTRRDAGDNMLVRGATTQSERPRSEPEPEMDKKPEQNE